MAEADEKKEGVVQNLTRHLLNQAGLFQEGVPLDRHVHYQKFRRQAETVVKYLGSEDYLSLVAALDRNDSVTILKLMRRANENQRQNRGGDVVEVANLSSDAAELLETYGYSHFVRLPETGSDLLSYLGLPHRHLPASGGFAVRLTEDQRGYLKKLLDAAFDRKSPLNKFYVNILPSKGEAKSIAVEAADAEDATNRAVRWFKGNVEGKEEDFDLSVTKAPRGRQIAELKDDAMREKVQEGILGMTKVPGLSRLRELAGLDLPGLQPAEEETIDLVDPVGAEFEYPDETPTDEPLMRAKKSTESAAFREAVDCLERARSLLDDMRIAEYRLFLGRVDEFATAVHQMGSELIDED